MKNKFGGLVILFNIITILAVVLRHQLADWKLNYLAVIGANLLFFLFGIISLTLHARALQRTNHHAFVRSVMMANIIRLFGVAGAAFIYFGYAGTENGANLVFAGLLLYILYTWTEKRATLRLSKSAKD